MVVRFLYSGGGVTPARYQSASSDLATTPKKTPKLIWWKQGECFISTIEHNIHFDTLSAIILKECIYRLVKHHHGPCLFPFCGIWARLSFLRIQTSHYRFVLISRKFRSACRTSLTPNPTQLLNRRHQMCHKGIGSMLTEVRLIKRVRRGWQFISWGAGAASRLLVCVVSSTWSRWNRSWRDHCCLFSMLHFSIKLL